MTAFMLDDSVVKHNRSKKVELLARIFNHTEHKYQRDFSMLTLGWTDGYSFVPVGFNMLSSANKSNRYQEMSDVIDHRANEYKIRRDSILSKPKASVKLITLLMPVLSQTMFLYILSTNVALSASEIVRIYYGELFHMFCDDIQDMDLTNSLQSLMALFVNIATAFSAKITEMIRMQVCNWMASQARFIQTLFSDLCWES